VLYSKALTPIRLCTSAQRLDRAESTGERNEISERHQSTSSAGGSSPLCEVADPNRLTVSSRSLERRLTAPSAFSCSPGRATS
jgi:hypothetical protein